MFVGGGIRSGITHRLHTERELARWLLMIMMIFSLLSSPNRGTLCSSGMLVNDDDDIFVMVLKYGKAIVVRVGQS